MKLLERMIDDAKYYKNKFSKWEASEIIIDDKKAFWCLKKPNSEYEKICLYRDGCNMFIYGEYGQFTFDKMTWLGSVYNLEYDNIGYQAEKLNYESKQALRVFSDSACKEDIIDWLQDRLEEYYYLEDEEIKKVLVWIEESSYNFNDFNIEEFVNKTNLFNIENILKFTGKCFRNVDEYEWIAFLRNNDDELREFDETFESWLWDAGKRMNQRYFICLYALRVCGEKLKEKNNNDK